MDEMRFPVWVAVGNTDARTARDALSPYLDGSGVSSVKAAIDRGTYSACDSARVVSVPNGAKPISIAGTDYLAAIFDVEVTGKGGA
jgi:hypothetical protein